MVQSLRWALLLTFFAATARAQTVWYVNDDAHGANNGTSWTDAYTDLHSALTAAQSGDQIWVAAGRYVGNFTLTLEVELYGGFAGTETELAQRDWKINETILDGNQTGSVVTSPPGATATTRIDGVTITNGSGGGVYLYRSSPTIANNTITGNSASHDGGGMYLWNSSPTIAGNTITGNSAEYGGGLYLRYSSPTIVNNAVTGNIAYGYGGGLYLYISFPAIADNTISSNVARSGGGGLYLADSSPTIANNTITGNSSSGYDSGGGGLSLSYSNPTIANNTITGNSTSGSGGGLRLSYSAPTIANNAITGNSTSGSGGGLRIYSSSPTIVNNRVTSNSAYSGGGLSLSSSSSTIANNSITGNNANWDGGGLYLAQSSPTIVNNTITGNNANWDGGGVYLAQSSPTIANTIVAFNSSGIYRDSWFSVTPSLRYNCVYGNTMGDYSGLGNSTGTDGNISADPRFVRNLVNGEGGNLRLGCGSPCIDAGDNTAVPADTLDLDGDGNTTEPIPFDLDSHPRFVNDLGTRDTGKPSPEIPDRIVDMGAYERPSQMSCEKPNPRYSP